MAEVHRAAPQVTAMLSELVKCVSVTSAKGCVGPRFSTHQSGMACRLITVLLPVVLLCALSQVLFARHRVKCAEFHQILRVWHRCRKSPRPSTSEPHLCVEGLLSHPHHQKCLPRWLGNSNVNELPP